MAPNAFLAPPRAALTEPFRRERLRKRASLDGVRDELAGDRSHQDPGRVEARRDERALVDAIDDRELVIRLRTEARPGVSHLETRSVGDARGDVFADPLNRSVAHIGFVIVRFFRSARDDHAGRKLYREELGVGGRNDLTEAERRWFGRDEMSFDRRSRLRRAHRMDDEA